MAPKHFHGGVPGLAVGELVRPAAETGYVATGSRLFGIYDDRYVYTTSSPRDAIDFAFMYIPPGPLPYPQPPYRAAVYEVEPLGATSPDPDGVGVPWCWTRSQAARVVEVVHEDVRAIPGARDMFALAFRHEDTVPTIRYEAFQRSLEADPLNLLP